MLPLFGGTNSLIIYAVLAISAAGAATDIYCGKIFNLLTLPALLLGVSFSAWVGGWAGLGSALLAVGLGLALYGWIFALGAMGAGDVKFLMALSAWGGTRFAVETALLGVAVGGILSLGLLLYQGKLMGFLKRMRHFLLTVFIKELEVETPKIDRSVTMPFGIPIAIAAAWVVLGHPFETFGVSLW